MAELCIFQSCAYGRASWYYSLENPNDYLPLAHSTEGYIERDDLLGVHLCNNLVCGWGRIDKGCSRAGSSSVSELDGEFLVSRTRHTRSGASLTLTQKPRGTGNSLGNAE